MYDGPDPTYTGNDFPGTNLCTRCSRAFGSARSFDAHLISRPDHRGDNRVYRCLHPTELNLSLDKHGKWTAPFPGATHKDET